MATESGENKYNKYGQPALDFIFTGTKKSLKDRSGNRQLQVTRNSVGTYVDENGVIQSAANNEARFDHDPVTGESLGLLVEESRTNYKTRSQDFSTGWTAENTILIPNSALAPDGTFTAASVVAASGYSGVDARIRHARVVSGGTSNAGISFFAKSNGFGSVYFISASTAYGTYYANLTDFPSYGNGWHKVFITGFGVPADPAVFYIGVCNASGSRTATGDGSKGIYIWGVDYQIGSFPTSYIPTPATFTSRASTATYYDASGVIQTAAIDVARDNAYLPDENGVMQPAGLLIEESRTNLLQRSEEFDDTYWFKRNSAAIVANTVVAPDGNTTADELQHPGGSTYARIETTGATPSVTSGVSYSFTIYAKYKPSSDANYLGIQFQRASGGSYINLSTKTVDSGDGDVELLGNDWIRFKRTFTASSTGTSQVYIYPTNTTNISPSSIAANAGLYIWGAQLEQNIYPTSYIPTAGSTVTRSADVSSSSTVTRAADVATLTNSNIYNTEAFTITNEPFGASGGSNTLSLVGPNIKRTSVYSSNLSQATINKIVRKTDEFWRWRILGSSFGLPQFTTDGQVTVDWGDGTVETLTTSDHTFTNGGGYHDVGFRLDSGTYFRPYINNNASHGTKLVAVGPAPESMKLFGQQAFFGCSNLEAFDATVDATGGTSFYYAWQNCSSLTSFPLINTSSGTTFQRAWYGCSSLTSFPLIDTSSGTNFRAAWQSCTSLTSFPLIDTSNGTDFGYAWYNCPSLTSFPAIDTSSGTNFGAAWFGCNSLTSFPPLDVSNGTTFNAAWFLCSSLANFPANFFDSWTGTPANNCFVSAWYGCVLTATSVENILNSIDTSGQSAPASGVDIAINYNTGTGTPSVATAVTNLKSRNWTITLNGVAQ